MTFPPASPCPWGPRGTPRPGRERALAVPGRSPGPLGELLLPRKRGALPPAPAQGKGFAAGAAGRRSAAPSPPAQRWGVSRGRPFPSRLAGLELGRRPLRCSGREPGPVWNQSARAGGGGSVLFIEDRVVNQLSPSLKAPCPGGGRGGQGEVPHGGPSPAQSPAPASGPVLARPGLGAALRRRGQAPGLGDQALDAHQPLAHLGDVVHHERAVDLVSRVPLPLLELCRTKGARRGRGGAAPPCRLPPRLPLAPHLAPGGSSSSSPALTASPESTHPPATSAAARCRRTLVSGSGGELEGGPARPQLREAPPGQGGRLLPCRAGGRGRGRGLTCTVGRQLPRASLSGARTAPAGSPHSSALGLRPSAPSLPYGAL